MLWPLHCTEKNQKHVYCTCKRVHSLCVCFCFVWKFRIFFPPPSPQASDTILSLKITSLIFWDVVGRGCFNRVAMETVAIKLPFHHLPLDRRKGCNEQLCLPLLPPPPCSFPSICDLRRWGFVGGSMQNWKRQIWLSCTYVSTQILYVKTHIHTLHYIDAGVFVSFTPSCICSWWS